MPRRSFTRKTGFRDSKLFIIVTEGELTEHVYFRGIIDYHYQNNSRIHVELLNKDNQSSDPKSCLIALNQFKDKYHLNSDDQLWLICDRDQWKTKMLAEVNQQCKQKEFKLAVSTPCFEFWLLLHLVDINTLSQDELDSFKGNCSNLSKKLRQILGSYNKSLPILTPIVENLEHAIKQAKMLDDGNDWPIDLGSKVWCLFESLSS